MNNNYHTQNEANENHSAIRNYTQNEANENRGTNRNYTQTGTNVLNDVAAAQQLNNQPNQFMSQAQQEQLKLQLQQEQLRIQAEQLRMQQQEHLRMQQELKRQDKQEKIALAPEGTVEIELSEQPASVPQRPPVAQPSKQTAMQRPPPAQTPSQSPSWLSETTTADYIITPIALMIVFILLVHPTTGGYLEKYLPAMDGWKGYLCRGFLMGLIYIIIRMCVNYFYLKK